MTTTRNATSDGCSCGFRQGQHLTSTATARPHLTERQREVILAWLQYGTKERVAEELFVTASTVKTHLQRVRQSYTDAGRPASSKFALFIRAVQDGLIDIRDDEMLRRFFANHDDR
ncbi:LuxR C-terminal-related transcriptional regulator [Mycolicibacterium llatzerense]|uniref:LuxR C-terminal-related transcriptional regulator n=1 Tax=Mycolicibacterium llatzerense TaxID=280871 RepID=UPI000DA1DEAB|nr:LuxR C-terminal-related transcriptional regulator [Mycolicibacterium llatzerense]